jgi:hypothetical protein
MAVEPKKQTGSHWGAWIWVKLKSGAPEDCASQWKQIKEIKDAWSTSGEWDIVLWLEIDDPDAIERFVWKEVRGNKWVEKTDTHWAKKVW